MSDRIYIADKPTLDSVKQDTEGILSHFPISGGTDFSAYTTKVVRPIIASTRKAALDIVGSGMVNTIIGANNSSWYYNVYITVDDISLGIIRVGGPFGNLSNLMLFFKESILIEAQYSNAVNEQITIVYGLEV